MIVLVAVAGVVVLCAGLAVVGALLPQQPPPALAPVATAPALPSLPAVPAPATTAEPSVTPSTSAAPRLVKVPDVVGQNAAVAEDRLRKLGFENVDFGSQDADDTLVLAPSNWTVTKQSTKPGKAVATDTLIVLTCTKQ